MAAPARRPLVIVYALNGPKHAARKEFALRTAKAAYPAFDVVVRNPSAFVAEEGLPPSIEAVFVEKNLFPELEAALKDRKIKVLPLPTQPSDDKDGKK